jgi:hypothetical protein
MKIRRKIDKTMERTITKQTIKLKKDTKEMKKKIQELN